MMTEVKAQTFEGGCHCGRVRFRVTADLSRVTYCNCSMCAKKGFLHLIVPPENFELLSGKDALTIYRFNTGAAQHTFCVCRGDRAMKSVPLDGEIRDGRHVLTVRVYYEDTDFTGIVYHASYLRFMERGRTNYLRMIGADHRALFEETAKEAPGFAFVVRSMNIDFLKPARMDDVLEVLTEPHDVKGASAMVRQRVMRGDELLVEAHVRVAFISGGRARPIPKPLRIAMKADQDAAQS